MCVAEGRVAGVRGIPWHTSGVVECPFRCDQSMDVCRTADRHNVQAVAADTFGVARSLWRCRTCPRLTWAGDPPRGGGAREDVSARIVVRGLPLSARSRSCVRTRKCVVELK